MIMRDHIIDFIAICPKKISVSDYKSCRTLSHEIRVVELKVD